MLELIDGFDIYGSGTAVGQSWQGSGNTFQPGRWGGSYLAAYPFVTKLLPSGSLATRTIGLAVIFPTNSTNFVGPSVNGCTFLSLIDSTTNTNQLTLVWTLATRNITVYCGSTLLAACAGPIPYYPMTWYYLEIQAAINSSSGSLIIKSYPGGTILNLSGINTQASSAATFDSIGIGGNAGIDDLYVTNPSGTHNTGFLGESRILTSFPSGDSSVNNGWTPSSGTVHYACVSQSNPVGDSPSVSANSAGLIDTYAFPTPTINGTIAGVQASVSARKTDTGVRQIAAQFKDNAGGEHTMATQNLLSQYSLLSGIQEVNPATGVAFIAADFVGAEFGMKVIT